MYKFRTCLRILKGLKGPVRKRFDYIVKDVENNTDILFLNKLLHIYLLSVQLSMSLPERVGLIRFLQSDLSPLDSAKSHTLKLQFLSLS